MIIIPAVKQPAEGRTRLAPHKSFANALFSTSIGCYSFLAVVKPATLPANQARATIEPMPADPRP